MYSIAELATARQHDADVTWLIVDDGGYGILREYMTGAFGQATATELARPDFAALAASFGVTAHVATLETVGEIIAGTFRDARPRRRRPARRAAHVRAHPPAVTRLTNRSLTMGKTTSISRSSSSISPPCSRSASGARPAPRTPRDFLVAGRRLGPTLYTGTMAAVVLGGASTVGGVGLGYKFGISGMWLVVAIAVGLLPAEPPVRRTHPAAEGLHRRADAEAALRRGRDIGVRAS